MALPGHNHQLWHISGCFSQEGSPTDPFLKLVAPTRQFCFPLVLWPCLSSQEMGIFGVLPQLRSVLAVGL